MTHNRKDPRQSYWWSKIPSKERVDILTQIEEAIEIRTESGASVPEDLKTSIRVFASNEIEDSVMVKLPNAESIERYRRHTINDGLYIILPHDGIEDGSYDDEVVVDLCNSVEKDIIAKVTLEDCKLIR